MLRGALADPAWCLDVLFSYFSWIGLGVSTVFSSSSASRRRHSAPTWAGGLTAGILKVASMLEQMRAEGGLHPQGRVVGTLSSSRQHRPHRPGCQCCSPGCTTCLSPGFPSGRCVCLLPYISSSRNSFLPPSFHIFGLFQSGVLNPSITR